MKRFMYGLVPFAKWVANYTVMWMIFTYVIPVPIGRYYEMGIGWVVSALLAAPFAYWAFHDKTPNNKQVLSFLCIWILVTVAMETLIAYIGYHHPLQMILRYELLVQLVLEIAVVIMIERVLRRHSAYNLSAEGIDLHN